MHERQGSWRRRAATTGAALLVGAAGLVVVGGAPAGAVTVSDEAGLRAAFADPAETEIVLANDIDLVDCGAGDLDRPLGGGLQPLTIQGQGFTIRQTCDERVMETDGELTLVDVTITGGNQPDSSGGGIRFGDLGTPSLTMRNSTVTGNRATGGGSGGGIDAIDAEFVLVIDSTISDNFAGDTGGGIRVAPSTTFVRSTISGNSIEGDTGFGGGIDGDTGTVLLVDSTVVGNTDPGTSASAAGGIYANELTAVYSTITQNSAVASIGGANITVEDPGPLNLFGTVIAQPLGGAENCLFELEPTTVSSGYNFSDDTSCALTDPTDVEDGGDPLLGALGANGGPTLTRLPQLGPPVSPLIDAIPVDACGDGDALAGEAVTTDQRGVTRPQAVLGVDACDIGAVEVEVPEVPLPLVLVPTFTG